MMFYLYLRILLSLCRALNTYVLGEDLPGWYVPRLWRAYEVALILSPPYCPGAYVCKELYIVGLMYYRIFFVS